MAKQRQIRKILLVRNGVFCNCRNGIFLATVLVGLFFGSAQIVNSNLDWFIVSLYIFVVAVGVLLLMRKGDQPEKAFLIIFIIVGSFVLIFIPPYSTPDFRQHFLRVYEIANGGFVTEIINDEGYAFLPANLTSIIDNYDGDNNSPSIQIVGQLFSTYINDDKLELYQYYTQSLYSPVSFIPSVVGVFVVSLFTNNLGLIIYAARMMSFLTIGVILYISIKNIPRGKTLITLCSLFPLALEIYPTCSPDGWVYSLVIALFSYVMYLETNKKPVNYMLLSALVIGLSLTKVVYLPICLIALLIPDACFCSRKRKYLILISLGIVALIANLVWLYLASDYLQYKRGASSSKQLAYVLGHPFEFAEIAMQTILACGFDWACQVFGSNMNAMNVKPPQLLPFILMLVFIYINVISLSPKSCSKRFLSNTERALVLFIVTTVFILTLLSLYIQWNSLRNTLVEGFQGRYTYPLLPLAMYAIWPHDENAVPNSAWTLWFVVVMLIFFQPLCVAWQ